MLCLVRLPASACAILLLFCCALPAGGCASRHIDTGLREQPRLAHMRDADDLRRLPQDLSAYARQAGKEELLSKQEQARQDARFDRIFFSPWKRTKPSVTAKELAARFGKRPQGFTEDARPWTREEWDRIRANAALASYPRTAQPAITIRHTSMRAWPTPRACMEGPRPFGQDNPFDMLQYSSLFLGTPLYASHISADGAWLFVESPVASGWVPATDVATADEAFMARYRTQRLAAVLRDELPLVTETGVIGHTHVGAVYPLHKEHARGLTILAPMRGAQGQAVLVAVELNPDQAGVKPLPLTPARIAGVGNQMMGQPYGWGGLYTWRDCSSTTRDLFAPFGIWLPRNSTAQSRSGSFLPLEGLDGADKERLIRTSGVPFMTLLWMRGHIMLYLGQYRNEIVAFHNVWGLRVATEGDDDARHVIGRAVVSSLRFGQERPDLKKGASLLDRLAGMVTLPASGIDVP